MVDLMNHRVGLLFGRLDLVGGVCQMAVASRGAFHQQVRSLADELHLLMKVSEKLLFAGE